MEYIGKHRKVWEVFDPRNGYWFIRTHSEDRARRLAKAMGLDYNLVGEGWSNVKIVRDLF